MSRWLPLLAAGLLSLGGCSSESPGPSAATLQVGLASPAQDDGAVLFTISGGPVDSIEAPDYQVYSNRIDANTLRVIVTGSLQPGVIARIHVPDQSRIADYSGVVDQVAARSSYALRDPAGYGLTLIP
jgi:hypothetical protein